MSLTSRQMFAANQGHIDTCLKLIEKGAEVSDDELIKLRNLKNPGIDAALEARAAREKENEKPESKKPPFAVSYDESRKQKQESQRTPPVERIHKVPTGGKQRGN